MMVFLVGCQVIESNTINVAGNAEITLEPDEAEVFAGISIVKFTAKEAQDEANEVVNTMILGLKKIGIAEKDISTEQLRLYEERRWENGKSKVVGWRATQTLKIKTTDLSKVGSIVDAAVNGGANQISNINFGLSKEKEQEAKTQALAEATKVAKEKAETIAASLDVRLGKIKRVSESNYFYEPRVYALEATAIGEAVAEAAQVLPGDVTVRANINLVYNVR